MDATEKMFAALRAPFPEDAIDWRIGQSGAKKDGGFWAKVLAYLTARAVMDRLDEACGPGNWWDDYAPGPQGGVVCRLTILLPDGRALTRVDGAENTDIEQVKGGISDSFKRAAVKFGIGRYLYSLGETWAECTTDRVKGDGWKFTKTKDGSFSWKAPGLPRAFLPPTAPPASTPPADKPKRRTPAVDPHERGDNHDWRQWTQEPAPVAAGENQDWYCQALKGLLHHIGAGSVGKARTMFAWLSPGEVVDVRVVQGRVAESKQWWQMLMEKSETVPFERMLHEAMQAAGEAQS